MVIRRFWVESDQMIDWEGRGLLLGENQVEPGAIRRGLIALGLGSGTTQHYMHKMHILVQRDGRYPLAIYQMTENKHCFAPRLSCAILYLNVLKVDLLSTTLTLCLGRYPLAIYQMTRNKHCLGPRYTIFKCSENWPLEYFPEILHWHCALVDTYWPSIRWLEIGSNTTDWSHSPHNDTMCVACDFHIVKSYFCSSQFQLI